MWRMPQQQLPYYMVISVISLIWECSLVKFESSALMLIIICWFVREWQVPGGGVYEIFISFLLICQLPIIKRKPSV